MDNQKNIVTFAISKVAKLMNTEKRIEELEELIKLIKNDLKNLGRVMQKIGWNEHLQKNQDLYLENLFEFMQELKKLKK